LILVSEANKIEEPERETAINKALFTLNDINSKVPYLSLSISLYISISAFRDVSQLYLVIRVNKLLRGDAEKEYSMYRNPKAVKSKDVERYQKETKELLCQPNPPMTPFVWFAVPLPSPSLCDVMILVCMSNYVCVMGGAGERFRCSTSSG
jgi:hypothetical protein